MGACRRRAEHAVNTVWAKLTTMMYYPVNIIGLENLPAADQPAVYVSNHQSFLVRGRVQWAPGGSGVAGGWVACQKGTVCLCLAPPPGLAWLPAGRRHQQRSCHITHQERSPTPTLPACLPARPQDIYTLFHLHRDFKFISKTSNFLIPIIGWSMFLTGG